jgi:hypothetical protein
MGFLRLRRQHNQDAKPVRRTPSSRPRIKAALMMAAIFALLLEFASATENGASVYPAGVETVLPGMTPPPHGTMLYEFSTFYSASQFADAGGHSSVPGFRLDVFANAVKLVHNWNVHVFGGSINSNVAVPVIYERLAVPGKRFSKTGIGNIAVGVAQIGYNHGNWHWSFEPDVWFPGTPYSKSDALNIGQHNFAIGPGGAFTYLTRTGRTEVSSKVLYIVNFTNPDTHYRSGHEFTGEYAVMQQVLKRLALGVNGYLYQQTTGDTHNGVAVGDGFRGRDFTIGPEIRLKLGARSGLALKYQRDTFVRNKPSGGAVWFQLCLPLPIGISE